MLAAHGAQSILLDYRGGAPVAVSFGVAVAGKPAASPPNRPDALYTKLVQIAAVAIAFTEVTMRHA